MKLKHRACFWTVIAGPLLLPVSAAVFVFILSSGGAYIGASSQEKVVERVFRVSATALEQFASQTGIGASPTVTVRGGARRACS
jgi:hypothetical protein